MPTYVKTGKNAETTTITGQASKTIVGEFLSVEIVSPYFTNEEAAIKFAGMFPKSVRARIVRLSGTMEGTVFYGCVRARHEKRPGNEKNETGLARIARAIKALRANGVEVLAYSEGFSSSLSPETLAEMFLG